MREFAQEADSKGELDRTGFYLCFQRLQTDVELSSDDYLKRREVLRQLFEVFDTNGNGKVTYLCSLFVCCARPFTLLFCERFASCSFPVCVLFVLRTRSSCSSFTSLVWMICVHVLSSAGRLCRAVFWLVRAVQRVGCGQSQGCFHPIRSVFTPCTAVFAGERT